MYVYRRSFKDAMKNEKLIMHDTSFLLCMFCIDFSFSAISSIQSGDRKCVTYTLNILLCIKICWEFTFFYAFLQIIKISDIYSE